MLLENNPYPQDPRVRNEAESLVAAGYRVTVVAPRAREQASAELVNGVRVRRYIAPTAGSSALSYVLEYGVAHVRLIGHALLAVARGARIVHFHGPPDTLVFAGVLARLAGRQTVFDMHDSGPELFLAKFGDARVPLRMLRAAQRRAMRWSSHVIVTNESQLALVRARGARELEHVSVVRNGPRAADFGEPPPARAGILDAPNLVYVGTLDTQDGVLALPGLLQLPALAKARLTVVGDGPMSAELASRVRDLNMCDRVVLTGRVPHSEVPRLIAAADIAIDPAPATELNCGSTMIKVVEYMAAGRPTVTYDLLETRRTAGPAALYAPCGDETAFARLVQELARDGQARLRIGGLARQRGLELAWDRSAEVLCDVYDRLAGIDAGA